MYVPRIFFFLLRNEIYETQALTITNYGKPYKNWVFIFVFLVPVKKKPILKVSVYKKNQKKKITINNSKCSIAFVHLPFNVVQ